MRQQSRSPPLLRRRCCYLRVQIADPAETSWLMTVSKRVRTYIKKDTVVLDTVLSIQISSPNSAADHLE